MVALGIPQKPAESISTDVEQGIPLEPQNTETTQVSGARQCSYGSYSGANFNHLTRTPSSESLRDRDKEARVKQFISLIRPIGQTIIIFKT